VLHETARYVAEAPDIAVVSFDDVASRVGAGKRQAS